MTNATSLVLISVIVTILYFIWLDIYTDPGQWNVSR